MSLSYLATILAVTVFLPAQYTASRRSDPRPLDALVFAETSYEEAYRQLLNLEPLADGVGAVSGLTIQRDVAHYTLHSGTVYLLSPVAGRTVAAVFLGSGTFRFSPPSWVEQEQLERFYEKESLEEPFNSALLIFTDSTLEQLRAAATFGGGAVPGDVEDYAEYAVEYLSSEDESFFDTAIMTTVLNEQLDGMFYAHVSENRGDPMILRIDPFSREQVQFSQRDKDARRRETAALVNQFPLGERDGTAEQARHLAEITDYEMECTIKKNLDFSARTNIEIASLVDGLEWLPLRLFYDLEVDSARWENGEPVTYFRGEENPFLWVQFDRPTNETESLRLELHYHGDLIYTDDYFHYNRSATNWYPRYAMDEPTVKATFDLTFHTPEKLTFATVGEKVSAGEGGELKVSRWVTHTPAPHVSFDLGNFDTYEIDFPGIPATTVLMADFGVRQGRSGLGPQAGVGADIANSLTFFHEMFGEPLADHFYAIEIPAFHGQAFPGLVQLSALTFGMSEVMGQDLKPGEDALFRAHEIAHQWWGMGVGFATYHDQWVNEGMSQFAGLWYVQTMLNKRKECVDLLKQWREDIYDREGESGPIWLGQRVATTKHPEDYQLMTYLKGAWVIHMLRGIMQDDSPSGDERFAAMLRDFYATNVGKDATTEQFRAIAEKHHGEPLDWFFDQWVYGTALPTYEFSHNTEESAGEYVTSVRIEQSNVPDDFRMTVPVMLDFGDDRKATFPVLVSGPVTRADLPAMPWEPDKVVLNPDESVLANVKNVRWRAQG